MSGFFYRLLFDEPLVAVTATGDELPAAVAYSARIATGRALHLLLMVNWYAPHQIDALRAAAADARRDHPNIHLTVMAATAADDRMFRDAGFDSFWCNHNCLVDEHVFRPDPATAKRFDAVYVGRLAPMKRHELAFDVPRVAVVSGSHDVEGDYPRAVIGGYRDLAWCNYDPGSGLSLIPEEETARIIAASRCGLALSALEGAMFASAEYLLCGLPVVTTPSVGGRDVFFHPDHVATVDPDPHAVAQAVDRFVSDPPDPIAIRTRTLAAFRPHRMRLLLRLSAWAQCNLFAEVDGNLWSDLFAGKMRAWHSG